MIIIFKFLVSRLVCSLRKLERRSVRRKNLDKKISIQNDLQNKRSVKAIFASWESTDFVQRIKDKDYIDKHKLKKQEAIKLIKGKNLGVEDVTNMLVDALHKNNFDEYDVSDMWNEMFIGAISQNKVFQPTFGSLLCESTLFYYRGMKDFWCDGAMFKNKEDPVDNDYFEVGEFTFPDNTRQYGVFAKKDFTYTDDFIHEGDMTMKEYFQNTMQMTGYLVNENKLDNFGWDIDDLLDITKQSAHGGLGSAVEIAEFYHETGIKTHLVSHGGTLGSLVNAANRVMVKAKIVTTMDETVLNVDPRFKEFLRLVKLDKDIDFVGCIENVELDEDENPHLIKSVLVYILPTDGVSFVKGEQLFLDYDCGVTTGFNFVDDRFRSGDNLICEAIKRNDEDAKAYQKGKELWPLNHGALPNKSKRRRNNRRSKKENKKRSKIHLDGSDSDGSSK